MSHTLGPWWYSDRHILGGPTATYVCEVSGAASNQEHIADANLIAAAPELLAACQEFIRKCECGEARSRRSYAQMKAAVAKVEGR
jgi:hypothetical protein